MNIVRIALFSVALFFAPYAIASQNDTNSGVNTPAITTPKTGIVAAIKMFANARKDNIRDGLDTVAGYTSTPVLKKLATFECLKGGKFENSIENVGRLFVAAVIVAGAYKLYVLYNASQEDNDDIIFEEEYNEDNN